MSIIFKRFSEYWPAKKGDRKPYSEELWEEDQGTGCGFGLEFTHDDPAIQKAWVGTRLPESATPDDAADALDRLSSAIRAGRWCVTGYDIRLGKEIPIPESKSYSAKLNAWMQEVARAAIEMRDDPSALERARKQFAIDYPETDAERRGRLAYEAYFQGYCATLTAVYQSHWGDMSVDQRATWIAAAEAVVKDFIAKCAEHDKKLAGTSMRIPVAAPFTNQRNEAGELPYQRRGRLVYEAFRDDYCQGVADSVLHEDFPHVDCPSWIRAAEVVYSEAHRSLFAEMNDMARQTNLAEDAAKELRAENAQLRRLNIEATRLASVSETARNLMANKLAMIQQALSQ